ncbi:MAG: molybdopterin oxidoreductase family protein [Planctomycetes bacterium]|nr:molybdopterin oxidoreductase family protein [Planctomycetota bacterium]
MKSEVTDSVFPAICPHDCPDSCALRVQVRQDELVRVEGDPDHPITRGFVCAKVLHYPRRWNSQARLLYPMKRVGAKGDGRFERITWDEALNTIAGRFSDLIRRQGPEAILPCFGSGTMGLIQMYYGGLRFFAGLGSTDLERTICSEAGKAGWRHTVGTNYGADPETCAFSRLILVWGANPHATNIHFLPILKEARRQGAKVLAIDPHRTGTALAADGYYQIRPGTDGLLALALMRIIIEEGLQDREFIEKHTLGFDRLRECVFGYSLADAARITGLSVEDIAGLARLYAGTKPAFIRIGIGVQHHTNGGMAVRAISCLPALVGAWGVPGGGALYNNSGAFPMNKETLIGDLPAKRRRRVNISQLGEALTSLSPPVSALYVYNGNPVLSLPDQNAILTGLSRPDLFTVVHEQMMTDTAVFADILLPATMQFEHFDLHVSYWHFYVGVNRPALPARGECKSNYEVFQLLAKRLGINDPALRRSPEEVALRMLRASHPYLEGIDAENLVLNGGFARLRTPEIPFVPFRDGRFGTPSGKVEFYSSTLEEQGHDPLPNYVPPAESREGSPDLFQKFPLQFLTPSSRYFLNSNFANLAAVRELEGSRPRIRMHVEDAEARGIREGDLVRVWNDRGSCLLFAQVGLDVPPGTVLATTLWWRSQSPDRTSPSATTSGRLADLGHGSTYNTNLVQVARMENTP